MLVKFPVGEPHAQSLTCETEQAVEGKETLTRAAIAEYDRCVPPRCRYAVNLDVLSTNGRLHGAQVDVWISGALPLVHAQDKFLQANVPIKILAGIREPR